VGFNDCRGWKKCEKVRKNAKNFEILQKMYAILRKKVWFLRNFCAFCELKKVCRKDENF